MYTNGTVKETPIKSKQKQTDRQTDRHTDGWMDELDRHIDS